MNPTPIDGLEIHPLDVHADNRGWFKENWSGQRLRPVQNNISFNARVGATRGMHAEPWDKWVSVATGRVFAAWVDLREGSETFATKFGVEIGPDTAVFVPRGVANGFQALEDATTYTYLVNARYNPNGAYAYCSYREIDWPLEPTELSEADQKHPPLADAPTVPPRKILVTGANGQLGRALRKVYSEREAEFCTRAEFDITHPPARDWNEYRAIINCAAYNDVNGAETERGTAWAVNADAVAGLARIASEHDLTLVHVSSDYVFDGLNTEHTEDELPSPLSAYGASKSAGETAARATPRHYVIRTSWVFGEGANFMDTMARLADKGVSPSVVADQRGRPTHADDLAHGIAHLLATKAEYGVYNITSDGDAVGRDEIAMSVFIGVGADPSDVTPVTTAQYAELNGPEAPRPKESTLSLDKIKATGFSPRNWRAALAIYLAAR
ncbi:dTDP-4-dehydrorhamnose reductase [Corynebacterium sanguinis]|uniref:dTDP-4-dehydrorhamnose reductase n=1 Tax=Corynebacterium sanguinis TaxID=2594913 RepID=UPI001184D521|nr:dTDP-4-dehydrorhamnose reductase [Corynebacterium sanguinis]MCT1411975.1 dTDP-4-dehydrorhamnose reductase [Corynebacterium sanguinis]MCT1444576.1 dTDP-4-dehydrorhamnose reductase [Corynebacterium sanguinis]MCT1597162.1 dTDP-4-dehydrorhamnose reductase [Corynebacterium sanguinis]MCT1614682.1 dTDP-4-dehydrorhamnose reductase [Corynebacterium sanguinis]MCT1627343.1 dTDP-4-dehydrorhamnose reductase [Corynebacterium sanguinis]